MSIIHKIISMLVKDHFAEVCECIAARPFTQESGWKMDITLAPNGKTQIIITKL